MYIWYSISDNAGVGGLQIVGNATQIILEIKGHDAIVDQEHSL